MPAHSTLDQDHAWSATAYASALKFDKRSRVLPEQRIEGPVSITVDATNARAGGEIHARFVGNGVDTPSFAGLFEHSSSSGYDVRNGIVNTLRAWYDGVSYWYAWGKRVGAAPVALVLSSLSNVTNTSGTYSRNAGGWDLTNCFAGASNLSLSISGFFEARYGSFSASSVPCFYTSPSSGAVTFDSANTYGVYAENGTAAYKIVLGGGGNAPNLNTSKVAAAGDRLRIGRTGTTSWVDVSQDGGATWTRIDSRATVSTVQRWANVAFYGPGTTFLGLDGSGIA